jgi:hypothetical protein
MTGAQRQAPVLFADAGPLITLAYASALDVLLVPGWQVRVVDMVAHEVTRNATPSSGLIGSWLADHAVTIVPTRTFEHYRRSQTEGQAGLRKSHLGELATQEAMHAMALDEPACTGIFLFEDHKIARASFLVPENCRKISTRAYLQFLEGRGKIDSATAIERAAIAAGRQFSQLRFPP